MRVSVGDIELHVRAEGDGQPLILLHGGPGLDGSGFFPYWSPLGDRFRLLAIDHRANGRSDAGDPARWTSEQMADDVERVIAALDLRDPIVLGWSFGSFVAQQHIVRHGTAAGYVLMGTVAEPGALQDVGERLAAFEPEELRASVTASWEREPFATTSEELASLLADQLPWHFGDPRDPRIAEVLAADETVYRPDVLRHFSADGTYGLPDLRDRLRRCERPVLILSGALDRTTPAASAHDLVDVIPGADEVVLDACGHMIPVEQPVRSMAAIRSFADRIGGDQWSASSGGSTP